MRVDSVTLKHTLLSREEKGIESQAKAEFHLGALQQWQLALAGQGRFDQEFRPHVDSAIGVSKVGSSLSCRYLHLLFTSLT